MAIPRPLVQDEPVTRYLISFDDGAMTFPEADLPAVADASHRVVVDGFSILDVASREDALAWAAKIAAACPCAQEVREIMDDPES